MYGSWSAWEQVCGKSQSIPESCIVHALAGMAKGRGVPQEIRHEGEEGRCPRELHAEQAHNASPRVEQGEVGWCLLHDCVKVLVYRVDPRMDSYRIKLSTPVCIFMQPGCVYYCTGAWSAGTSQGRIHSGVVSLRCMKCWMVKASLAFDGC